MGPRVSVLIVFLAVLSVAQGLMCNYCQSIEKNHPYCEQMEEIECSMGLTQCIRLIMHEPAYGEVRRCASTKECEEKVSHLVEKECCDTDFCN
ncbi:hypothetical protein KOW79_011404 [Hemibagrus wyckioides]|uniref:Uncharacterized protein n=1 Tax=Hemibagrus wyckioides TaxID=337641 RepID=A0A9D3NLE4_9TELE|nr:hypothetical protein KOW79_011404 [Hemibagrus wyckioides]